MDFESIIKRIKELKGIRDDQEVASLLGLSKGAFSERKRRGSIPKKELELFCSRDSINIDWLLSGEGLMRESGIYIRRDDKPELIKEADIPIIAGDAIAGALARKLSVIYREGDRGQRAAVRGVIEEVYDEITWKKREVKKGERNKDVKDDPEGKNDLPSSEGPILY